MHVLTGGWLSLCEFDCLGSVSYKGFSFQAILGFTGGVGMAGVFNEEMYMIINLRMLVSDDIVAHSVIHSFTAGT